MDRVYDSFEKALLFVRSHPDWFDWSGEKLKRALELHDNGFLKVMKERDSEGRRIILINNKLDMDKHNADDVFRLHCLVILLLSMEEETQICGAIYVDDFSTGVTMKYFAMYPLRSMYDFTLQLKVTPIRLKNICLIGLPSFASQFLNIVKLGLSDVMNKRLQVLDDVTDCWNYVDQSKMTKEYGGMFDDNEVIDDFNELINKHLETLKKFFDFEIDMAKAEVFKNIHENVGSFRKLEID